MKARTKSIFALSGTLILGMVLGGLIASQLIRSHIREFRQLREPGHFRSHLVETIDPTPEQLKQIEPILDEFSAHMQEMRKKHMQEMHEHLMLFRESLGAFLEPGQIQRLEKQLMRLRGRFKRHRRERHGPGF